MAKKGGLRDYPKLQYDIKAEQHWVPPLPKPVGKVVFVKPKEEDIHLAPSDWMA